MARNRIIYSNEILMVSPTATGVQFLNQDTAVAPGRSSESLLRQIKRTQSINYSWNVNRSDVNQYGNLARIDSVVLESPTVNLDFTYLLTDGKNEHLLGLDTHDGSSMLSKDFIRDSDGRNFYIMTSPEGKDAVPDSVAKIEAQSDSDKTVIALGNCYITNYSLNAAIGGLPTISVSAEAFNIRASAGTLGTSPGVNTVDGSESTYSYKIPSEHLTSGAGESALRPGDLSVTIGGSGLLTLLSDEDGRHSAHIQSVSIDVPLPRTTLQRVGNQFGYSKSLDVPISVSVGISAIVADQAVSSHSLFEELYANNKNDLTLTFRKPSAGGAKLGDKMMIFKLENATLDAENYGMAIGDNRTVDYTFSATVGDPDSAGSALGSTLSMQASGVYEKLQIIETGKGTDTFGSLTAGEGYVGYGTAVAANDKYLVVGASGFKPLGSDKQAGCAWIYKNDKGFYSQILQTSGNDLLAIDGAAKSSITNNALLPDPATAHDENFGCSASITKEHLVAIGMSNSPEDGAVAILEPDSENEDVFRINSVLKDGVGTDGLRFADAVAFDKKGVSGDGTQFLAIGSPHYDYVVGPTGGAGQVVISFGKKGQVNSFHGAGSNVFALSPSQAFMATPVQDDGTTSPYTAEQHLGESVAMYDRIVVAGAPRSRILATTKEVSGTALVWMKAYSSGTAYHQWKLTNVLTGTDWGTTAGQDQNAAFGTDVDVFDETMAVGAPSGTYNGLAQCGAVFMFTGKNSRNIFVEPPHNYGWTRAATLTASDSAAGDRFGNTVSMPNSHTLVVGAPGEDPYGASEGGSLYVFTGYDGNWTETQKISYTGARVEEWMGFPEDSLATTQKEIFVGIGSTDRERVLRYRI